MPNKNYIAGTRKEREMIHYLKARGFDISFRSAGSHSPIDVVAINKKTRVVLFIQSKPDSMSKKEKNRIENEHKELNTLLMSAFVCRSYKELKEDFALIEAESRRKILDENKDSTGLMAKGSSSA